jgi:hypothetical protein
MNTLTLIKRYPTKINIDLYANLTLIKNKLLDSILNSDYKYKTLDFGKRIENETTKHLLKTITKVIEYNYNLVYQDKIKELLNKTYRAFYIYHSVSFILYCLRLILSLAND